MKKYISPLVILLALAVFLPQKIQAAYSQVSTTRTSHDGESRACLSVTLDTDAKELEKAWTKFLDKNHDIKMSGGDFLTAEEVTLTAISNRTMDLYTKLIEKDDKVEMQVFGRYGYDVYIDQQNAPQDFEKMRALLQGFVTEYLQQVYTEKIEMQAEIVDDLRDAEEDLSDEMADMESDIEDNKKEIEALKKENEEYTKEIAELRSKRTEQNKDVQNAETELKALKMQRSEISQK